MGVFTLKRFQENPKKKIGPEYLSELVSDYQPVRVLRSASKQLLSVPPKKEINTVTYGERSFKYLGPKLWNDIPQNLKNSASKESFKRNLKTFLF